MASFEAKIGWKMPGKREYKKYHSVSFLHDALPIFQVHDYRDVNHIGEDIIHEPLKTSQGIGEPLRHH